MTTNATNRDEVDAALLGITNTVSDLLRADYGTYQRTVPKLSRLFHTPPLDKIADSLKSKVNLKKWIDDGNATQSSMVGSGTLPTPGSLEEELGLVIALVDAFSDGAYGMLETAMSFFYVSGSQIAPQLQNMTQQLLVGFARDFAIYAKKITIPTYSSETEENNMDPLSPTASTSAAELAPIQRLLQLATNGQNLLAKPELQRGSVTMWFGTVRSNFRRIYGEGSGVELNWGVVPDGLSGAQLRDFFRDRLAKLEGLLSVFNEASSKRAGSSQASRIFIGHGRSPVWRDLKDFLVERLNLPYEEFNRESTAGIATTERIEQMLDVSTFAFLVMTAEDERADATLHARVNVVHEAGLFQGRLGTRRAIILLEDGCQQFSNIHGLTHIPFPKGRVSAVFEDVRRVLEREKLLNGSV